MTRQESYGDISLRNEINDSGLRSGGAHEGVCEVTSSYFKFMDAKAVCYGDYYYHKPDDELENPPGPCRGGDCPQPTYTWTLETDMAFVRQKINARFQSPLCPQGPPCRWEISEHLEEGMHLTLQVYRRKDIRNDWLPEWEFWGTVQGMVVSSNDPADPGLVDIPVDADVELEFGWGFRPAYDNAFQPGHGGIEMDEWWDGIPCRRPYEELLFKCCFGQFRGKGRTEDGLRLIDVYGVPCSEWSDVQFVDDDISPWEEPNNVLEVISSRSQDNIVYGEPHTTPDAVTPIDYFKKTQIIGTPADFWCDLYGDLCSECCTTKECGGTLCLPWWMHPHPNDASNHPIHGFTEYCDYEHTPPCSTWNEVCPLYGNPPYPIKPISWFNAMYRFGPYKDKRHFKKPLGDVCAEQMEESRLCCKICCSNSDP